MANDLANGLSLYMRNHQVVHIATGMQSFPSRCCIHSKVLKIHRALTLSAFVYGCKYLMIHSLMYQDQVQDDKTMCYDTNNFLGQKLPNLFKSLKVPTLLFCIFGLYDV